MKRGSVPTRMLLRRGFQMSEVVGWGADVPGSTIEITMNQS